MGWIKDAIDNFFGIEPEEDPIVSHPKSGPVRESETNYDHSEHDYEVSPEKRPYNNS
jgi:hypothetical protein